MLQLRVRRQPEFSQGAHGRASDHGVFEQQAVVDRSNIFAGSLCLRPSIAQQVENANSQLAELAVFDELGKVLQRVVFAFCESNQVEKTFDNSSFEFVAAFFSKRAAQKGEDRLVFVRKLYSKSFHGVSNSYFQIV